MDLLDGITKNVAGAIVRVAENGEDAEGAGVFDRCDVIAMASHGHDGIERWALGSITERVLNATRLPLLIVRQPDLRDSSLSGLYGLEDGSNPLTPADAHADQGIFATNAPESVERFHRQDTACRADGVTQRDATAVRVGAIQRQI